MDHTVTDQSFDERAGSLETLFQFEEGHKDGRQTLEPARGLPTHSLED